MELDLTASAWRKLYKIDRPRVEWKLDAVKELEADVSSTRPSSEQVCCCWLTFRLPEQKSSSESSEEVSSDGSIRDIDINTIIWRNLFTWRGSQNRVKTSVNTNSLPGDYSHPDDHNQHTIFTLLGLNHLPNNTIVIIRPHNMCSNPPI